MKVASSPKVIVLFVCDCVQACCVLGSRLSAKHVHDSATNSKSCITFVVEQESFTAHYTVHSCNASCHGNRVCTGSNDCVCQTGYRGVDCGITVCPNNCSNNGVCDMVRTLHPYTCIVSMQLNGCVLWTKIHQLWTSLTKGALKWSQLASSLKMTNKTQLHHWPILWWAGESIF